MAVVIRQVAYPNNYGGVELSRLETGHLSRARVQSVRGLPNYSHCSWAIELMHILYKARGESEAE
jgi:hypothetical protein